MLCGRARYCLSATATQNNITLIVVLLGSPTSEIRWDAIKAALDWGFSISASEKPTRQYRKRCNSLTIECGGVENDVVLKSAAPPQQETATPRLIKPQAPPLPPKPNVTSGAARNSHYILDELNPPEVDFISLKLPSRVELASQFDPPDTNDTLQVHPSGACTTR